MCFWLVVVVTVDAIAGVFPGPTIEARSGDHILLRVRNELATEPTAVHFHGIRQLGSNAMDGTPGLTQVFDTVCEVRRRF